MTGLADLLKDQKMRMPLALKGFKDLTWIAKEQTALAQEIEQLFPYLKNSPSLELNPGAHTASNPLIVGVLFSGGQASGGHNVIVGLYHALKSLHPANQLLGFLNGPKGLMHNRCIEITDQLAYNYTNQGGFDMLGSGRDKFILEKDFKACHVTAKKNGLDGLVVIGGDDSNTNAAHLAEYFLAHACKTNIVGIPKTIDGDLKSKDIEISFGFDTATKTYSEIIGSLARDALSAKKYTFFVKLMGRSASHVALECALQTNINYTFISEEVKENKQSFKDIVNILADVIEKRSKKGKDYGVILIPEGLIECIPDFSLDCLDLDPHGNVQVSKIETERLLIEAVKKELQRREFTGQFNPQPFFCGYEGRSCLPSFFDAHYCYALGHVAALLIKEKKTGYMAVLKDLHKKVENWIPYATPLVAQMVIEERKGKKVAVIEKTLVDLQSPLFKFFLKKREENRLEDYYTSPGPIQFFGEKAIVESVTLSLHYA
jgi:diphosphate-dependent phosphofructokinase